ncbi:MAG TPA: hypothetical protein VG476_06000, partial [Acidimicrobiales bacterium]|nr:hypothetical protein [Acidimicrobiales bacterium]
LVVPILHLPYLTLYHDRVFGPYSPNFIAYSCLYLAIGLAYWGAGLLVAGLYARSHRTRLIGDLARSS